MLLNVGGSFFRASHARIRKAAIRLDILAIVTGVVLLVIGSCLAWFVRPWLNAATIYNWLWGGLLFFQGCFQIIDARLAPVLVLLVFVGGIAITGGTLLVHLSRRRQRPVTFLPLSLGVRQRAALCKTHLVLLAMLVAYSVFQLLAVWPVVVQVGGPIALFDPSTGAAREFKAALARSANSDEPFGGSVLIGIASYITYLGNASVFSGALLMRERRWVLAVLPLFVNGVFSLLSFQRNSFALAVLLFVCTLAVLGMAGSPVKRLRGAEIARPVKMARREQRWALNSLTVSPFALRMGAFIAAGVAAAAVLIIPIQIRNSSTADSSGVASLLQYVFGSIAGLSARAPDGWSLVPPMIDGAASAVPGYGAYTFTKAVGLLSRLGLPVSEPPYVYDYYTVTIFGNEFTTNTATLLYDLYLDGGFVFSAIFLFGVGAVGFMVQTMPGARLRLLLAPVAGYLLAVVVWSFFTASLLRDVRNLGTVICAVALGWFWLYRVKGDAHLDTAQPEQPQSKAGLL